MNINTMTSIVSILILSISAGSAVAAPKNVGTKAKVVHAKTKRKVTQRQVRQSHRIKMGMRTGQLTKKETQQLVRQQKNIQRTKRRMIKNDGTMSTSERRALKRKQRRASRNIFRARHNRRTR